MFKWRSDLRANKWTGKTMTFRDLDVGLNSSARAAITNFTD